MPFRSSRAALVAALLFPVAVLAQTRPLIDRHSCSRPDYPAEARRLNQTGTVELAFTVDADGSARDVTVTKSSGHPALDEASRAGVLRCQFTPGRQDGKAVTMPGRLAYEWTLEGPPANAANRADYEAKAVRGDAAAQFELAQFYMLDEYADKAKARDWLMRAAAQGEPRALEKAGDMAFAGRDGPKDAAAAAAWYRKAADAGSASAQFKLGSLYQNGEGVAKDPVEAVRLLRAAAAQGMARAQGTLGAVLLDVAGPSGDVAEAVGWLEKAAAQNDVLGLWLLGHLAEDGRGMPANPVRAAQLYGRGAEQGDNRNRRALATLYETGRGVPIDIEKAQALRTAASFGAGGTSSPVMIAATCRQVAYPDAARAAGLQGATRVDVIVGADGVPREPRIHTSSGHPLLDEASLQSALSCRFKPATREGKPVESRAAAAFSWVLED